MERDRILFQRQRVSTVASIQQQGAGTVSWNEMFVKVIHLQTVITQQISNDQLGNYQRKYSTNRGRRPSNFSR